MLNKITKLTNLYDKFLITKTSTRILVQGQLIDVIRLLVEKLF